MSASRDTTDASTPPVPRVLVGEPDARTANLIRHRLVRLCCEVTHVTEGPQALDLAEDHAYALIVLDLRMPGMHGLELLKRLRQSPQHSRTPIVMLSSTTNEQDLERAFAIGASDYIRKPFSPKEFVARVGRFLRAQAAGDAYGVQAHG